MSRVPPSRTAGAPNEWYTPACSIELVRQVIGEIELDPASSPRANETIRAARYYTTEQDGLRQSWQCASLWLNPPYGRDPVTKRGNMDIWTDRLICEYEHGNVGEALALVTAIPDRQWWHKLWAYPVCFCHRQIMFERPDGTREHHPYGSCFVYFGTHTERFAAVFHEIGTIVLPPVQQGASHVQHSL
jgi:hypothetical protein